MASASGYNHHRFARAVLKKSRRWEPSLTIELHQNNWRFERSAMLFTYDGPMKPFLMALRAQVIPPALIPFLYDIKPPVSFVDGCLVVEIHDLRRSPEARSRVVMRPAAEALSQTIDVMLDRRGHGGDERLALELESRILSATSPPLYLGTSILATRNAVLSLAMTAPAQPNLSADGTPRSTADTSLSSNSSDFDRMRRLLRAGDPNFNAASSSSGGSSGGATGAPFQPTWSVLRAKERALEIEREKAREKAEQAAAAAAAAAAQAQAGYAAAQAQANGGSNDAAAGAGDGQAAAPPKKKSKKKRPAASAEDDSATATVTGNANNATETKKPPAKKKKTNAAAATKDKEEGGGGGGGADKDKDKDKKVKIEPAAQTGTNVTPEKPKKPKKKKPAANPSANGASSAPTAAATTAASQPTAPAA